MSFEKKLRFKNGCFTVLQVSDAQDLQFVRPTMFSMLNAAYDRVQPDLVLFTGDQVLGNHLRDCNRYTRLTVRTRADEKKALRKALKPLLLPLEKRGIPFAMIFGNHDDMNLVPKQEHAALYAEYAQCVGLNFTNPEVDCDTYELPICGEKTDEVRFRLWLLDSAWFDKLTLRSHHYVTEKTVRWFEKKNAELKALGGSQAAPSIVFQHIPMIETLELIEECAEAEGSVCENGRYYRLKKGVRGVMGEFPSVCSQQTGEFEAIKSCGNVKAVVFGHDHMNSFTGSVEGIDFIQTGGASFRCYGSSAARSVRVFRLFENGAYETETLSYWDLMGRNPVSAFRYFWEADEMVKWKIGVLGGAALCGAAAITAAALCKKK